METARDHDEKTRFSWIFKQNISDVGEDLNRYKDRAANVWMLITLFWFVIVTFLVFMSVPTSTVIRNRLDAAFWRKDYAKYIFFFIVFAGLIAGLACVLAFTRGVWAWIGMVCGLVLAWVLTIVILIPRNSKSTGGLREQLIDESL